MFDLLHLKLDSPTKATFKIGDIVRISRKKGTFEKGFKTTFTEGLFIVSQVLTKNPVTYKLTDL